MPMARSMLRRSKDAFLSGRIVPIDDPCNKHIRLGSGRLLVGMGHRCTTIHLRMLLPKLGRSAIRSRWRKVLLNPRWCCFRRLRNLLLANGYHRCLREVQRWMQLRSRWLQLARWESSIRRTNRHKSGFRCWWSSCRTAPIRWRWSAVVRLWSFFYDCFVSLNMRQTIFIYLSAISLHEFTWLQCFA